MAVLLLLWVTLAITELLSLLCKWLSCYHWVTGYHWVAVLLSRWVAVSLSLSDSLAIIVNGCFAFIHCEWLSLYVTVLLSLNGYHCEWLPCYHCDGYNCDGCLAIIEWLSYYLCEWLSCYHCDGCLAITQWPSCYHWVAILLSLISCCYHFEWLYCYH